MQEFAAQAEGIAAYGAAEAAIAAEIASTGAINIGAIAAALTPTFGLLGTEHLIATIVAMTTNLFETGQIAAVHAGQSVLAHTAAAAYTATEESSAATLGSAALTL